MTGALIVFTLLGCSDPKPVALAACQALPQLSTDAAGIEALRPHIDPREIALLEAGEPTLGMQKVGSDGLATLRSAVQCTLDLVEPAGSGRWAVSLTRTQLQVAADGTIGEPHDVKLEWQVAEGQGGIFAETGIREASTKRHLLATAAEEHDYMRLAAGWRGIVQSFPDPVLTVDVAAAEHLDSGWTYRQQLVPVGAGALDPETLALQVQNAGDKDVERLVMDLSYVAGGEEGHLMLEGGPVAAGATVELRGSTDAPLAADVGGFNAQPVEVALAAN
ncbi:MAG: hypothetical protein H6742_11650 [Alphaproteobacteria bacterium]|nr:hypothetical protein [Alphaproteobacteria bacterium]